MECQEKKEFDSKYFDIAISLIIKFRKQDIYEHIFEKFIITGKREIDIVKNISRRCKLTTEETNKIYAAYRKWKERHEIK